MLKSVKLRNFIRLSENYELKFHEGGPYFMIGENASGKSSVLEALRRCMSYKSNTALSSIGNTQEDSYVICEYELSGTFHHEFLKAYVCLVHLKSSSALQPGQEKKEKHYKLAYIVGKDSKDSQLGIDVVIKGSKADSLLNKSIDNDLTKEEKGKIIDALEMLPATETNLGKDDEGAAAIIDILREHDQNIVAPENPNDETDCERVLEIMDECVAFIFENRGIGPMQWSQTRKEAPHWRSQDKVQIIKHFLFERKLDEDEQKEEEGIFSILTDDAELKFYPDGEGNIRIEEHGMDYDLLKAPEGLLEAKQCSILLALKRYTTLCLEEPERGMHPQMIQRLRDLFLFNPNLQKKTILITTHHPTFLAPWTVPKTFIFRRKQIGKNVVHKIIPGRRLVEGKDRKTPRIITSGPLPKLFFSRRVILVEGENDFSFVTALMYQILKGSKEVEAVIRKLGVLQNREAQPNTEILLKKLKHFLSSADLVQMQGETKKERLTQICKALDLDHYFLLDRNAVLEEPSEGSTSSPKEVKDKQQHIVYKLTDLNQAFGLKSNYEKGIVVNATNWENIRSELYSKGVFIWRDGDLEDMVIRLCDRTRRTFELLEEEESKHSEAEGQPSTENTIQDDAAGIKTLREKLEERKITIKVNLYQKKKSKAKFKLYPNKDLKDEDINESMKLMLEECKVDTDDLVHFIKFVLECAMSEIPGTEVSQIPGFAVKSNISDFTILPDLASHDGYNIYFFNIPRFSLVQNSNTRNLAMSASPFSIQLQEVLKPVLRTRQKAVFSKPQLHSQGAVLVKEGYVAHCNRDQGKIIESTAISRGELECTQVNGLVLNYDRSLPRCELVYSTY